MNNRYDEIFKLDKMLTAASIPHDLVEMAVYGFTNEGYQIRMYIDTAHKDFIDDCVCHPFSHGFNESLLETYSLNGCAGYETADEVFEGWVKMYADTMKGEN